LTTGRSLVKNAEPDQGNNAAPRRSNAPLPIDRPIFVVAPPRCGTTLLYECLAAHPDVGYFNRANGNWPNSPRFAHLVTKVGGALRVYRDSPRESSMLWYRFLQGKPDDLADERDATPQARAWYEQQIATVLALRGAKRYAAKMPAHSVQVPYLDALFEGALFVQPVRDWHAVVASLVVKRAKDEKGWFGVRLPGFEEQAKRPPHLGAAWNYRVVHERLAAEAAKRPTRFLQVRYEELTARPKATMRRVFDFCGLRCDDAILSRLPEMKPDHARWKQTLTPEMVAEIERENGDLSRFERGPSGDVASAASA
jgi:hypothetical protein